MFLHLRWFGIDVAPYKQVTVSAALPYEDVEYLKKYLRNFRNIDFFTRKTSDPLNIPYSEAFRRAIVSVKQMILGQYRKAIIYKKWEEQPIAIKKRKEEPKERDIRKRARRKDKKWYFRS